ncbi:MAG: hypothetical protein IKF72_12335 [Kiritimatiellae bacterium]|nr:hypothetical protein [Kiritimatiellia bacterium]MBR6734059.1 hypothetical protein [Kiritimatiellia bacterium]
MQDLISLGKLMRERQTAQALKRLEPELKGIRADYDRQLAEKDAEIADLRKKNDELTGCLVAEQEENAALKNEIVALKDALAASEQEATPEQEAAPKQTTPRKGRRK